MSDIDQSNRSGFTRLVAFVETYDWENAIQRLATHPQEAKTRGPRGRTALHIACDHDAPSFLVRRILSAFPDAARLVGTSNMTPLHITCSSQHASMDVVQVLLEGSPTGTETSMRDVDGDTPLHAACRCGAPIQVLCVLLEKEPNVVLVRDYEGLSPLLRLWVRYFVILGDDVIDAVRQPADIKGDLSIAWEKTNLLLQVAHHGSIDLIPGKTFRVVHSAAAVDCPRSVLKIAIALHPEQLTEVDEEGETPLFIACRSPIYKVHDLSANGYNYDDFVEDGPEGELGAKNDEKEECLESSDDNDMDLHCLVQGDGTVVRVPSVISIILEAKPELIRVTDISTGKLPLHASIESGKGWSEGVESLVTAYPESVCMMDAQSGLYPFMLAAVGKKGGSAKVRLIFELLRLNPELVRKSIWHDSPNSVGHINCNKAHETSVKLFKNAYSEDSKKHAPTDSSISSVFIEKNYNDIAMTSSASCEIVKDVAVLSETSIQIIKVKKYFRLGVFSALKITSSPKTIDYSHRFDDSKEEVMSTECVDECEPVLKKRRLD
eukprot:CAMPEP_0194352996 /NCGR_PEP_ID=MMETSP0174-20130528/1369_1 /TAXON_ID=216777 /ORGANISM="Proboscia alata, Strain PI-D3" /LENGTH=548 /DNA_ID=CAMNT_0039121341 /DNA_START=29 /DNA_END=1675 /DNA_ORIENTATION=+